MVGMGMVEADDFLAAVAAFKLNADEFFGIDAVAVVRRVGAGVAAAGDAGDGLGSGMRSGVVEVAEQDAAAFVGIGFFSVSTKGGVGGLGNFQHGTVRGRRSEVRLQR